MKKLLFLSAFLLPFVGGCSFSLSTSTEVNVDTLVNSGAEMLSGAWSATKEVSKEFYDDQIKPAVDTAIDVAQQELEKLAQEAKNQYNQGVETLNIAIQGQADQAKDQVNKLKVE